MTAGQAAALASACALALYAATAAPGLTGGDAGELIATARSFSTAHPPGYPLYVLLGGLFARLPLGGLAHRLNLFSAACGAGCAGLVVLFLARWTRSLPIALAGAAAFALSPLAWTWSTRAEVFALANLCAAGLLWAALLALTAESHRGRWLALAAGLFGLGLGDHHTLLFLGGPVLLAAALPATWRDRAWAAAAFACGLLVYLQVPLGAWLSPERAWGDVTTPGGFLGHLLRRDYGTFRLAQPGRPEAPLAALLGSFGRQQLEDLGLLGAPLAAAGAIGSLRRPAPARGLALALVAAYLLCALLFHALARFPLETPIDRMVLERFRLLPLLVAVLFAARGLAALLPGPRAQVAACTLVVALSLWRGASAAQAFPRDRLPEAWAEAALSPLPPGAVLLSRGDLLTNALGYAQLTGARPDLLLLDQELLTYPWYVARRPPGGLTFPGSCWRPAGEGTYSLGQLLAANPRRRFFVAGGLKPGDPSAEQAWERAPAGLTEELVPRGDAAALAQAALRAPQLEQRLDESRFAALARLDREAPWNLRDPWDRALVQERWEAPHRRAVALISRGDPPSLEAAERLLEELIARHPEPPFQYFLNLAIAASRLAHREVLLRAVRGYLARAPASAPERPLFEAALAQLVAGAQDPPL